VALSQEIARLRDENVGLWRANADLVVERNATDDLLGTAIDLIHQYGIAVE
jgi:hypothetical protein